MDFRGIRLIFNDFPKFFPNSRSFAGFSRTAGNPTKDHNRKNQLLVKVGISFITRSYQWQIKCYRDCHSGMNWVSFSFMGSVMIPKK